MKVQLEVSDNKANIKRVVIKNNAVLGRSKECNLRIASSQVSRHHCRITILESQVFVTDLNSSNGTFLNGKPIPSDQPIKVAPGNELSVGPARFIFRFEAPLGSLSDDPGSTVDLFRVTQPENGTATTPENLADEAEEFPVPIGEADTADSIVEAADLPEEAADEPMIQEEVAAEDIVINVTSEPEEEEAPAAEPSLDQEVFAADEDEEEPVLEMKESEDEIPNFAVESAEEEQVPIIETGEDDDAPEPILEADEEPTLELEPEDETPPAKPAAKEKQKAPEKKKSARNDEDEAFSFLSGLNEGDESDGEEDLGDFLSQFK